MLAQNRHYREQGRNDRHCSGDPLIERVLRVVYVLLKFFVCRHEDKLTRSARRLDQLRNFAHQLAIVQICEGSIWKPLAITPGRTVPAQEQRQMLDPFPFSGLVPLRRSGFRAEVCPATSRGAAPTKDQRYAGDRHRPSCMGHETRVARRPATRVRAMPLKCTGRPLPDRAPLSRPQSLNPFVKIRGLFEIQGLAGCFPAADNVDKSPCHSSKGTPQPGPLQSRTPRESPQADKAAGIDSSRRKCSPDAREMDQDSLCIGESETGPPPVLHRTGPIRGSQTAQKTFP